MKFIPQYIVTILQVLALGIAIAKHGDPKKPSKHNFWIDLASAAITVGLLAWGGFYAGMFR